MTNVETRASGSHGSLGSAVDDYTHHPSEGVGGPGEEESAQRLVYTVDIDVALGGAIDTGLIIGSSTALILRGGFLGVFLCSGLTVLLDWSPNPLKSIRGRYDTVTKRLCNAHAYPPEI